VSQRWPRMNTRPLYNDNRSSGLGMYLITTCVYRKRGPGTARGTEKLSMPEQSTNPLPQYLREAFQQTVTDYWGWQRGSAEPEVSLQHRRPCSISTVCSMVMNFDEAMPENVCRALYKLDTSTDELAKDHSYRNDARWLLRLIDARKADYGRTRDL